MAPLDPISLIISAIDQVSPVVGGIENRISRMVSVISPDLGKLSQQLTSVSGWYDLLINQNVQLQQQLLSTQATLVGTNRILQNGLEIADPTAAIKALEGPVNSAIDRIRQGSLELVGVTSAELVPIFQVIAGQASQIGADLNDVADITLSAAASLGTLGIPLFQSRQELTSILQGSIDINSALAKSINLTNTQVNQWKAQGVLVEKLQERLSAFRAGNAIAAQTIEGIASNIAELVQVATQKGGEDLLQPLVRGLNSFYEFLKANQGAIDEFFNKVTQAIESVISPLIEAGDALADRFGSKLGNVIASSLDLVIQAFQGLGYAIAGTINAFVEFDKQVPFVSAQLQNINEVLATSAEGWKKLKAAVDLYSGAQADSDEATAQYQKNANFELDKALKVMQETTPRLKELQQKQKDGLTLTKSETDELARLQARRSSAAEGLRSLSLTLGEASVVGEENQATLKGLTSQLEFFAGQLIQTDLAARDITKLGNTFKQLEDKASSAMRTIAEGGGGDSAKFNAAAKELVDITNQQVGLGAIARTEGIKRLVSVRDDSRTEVGVQQAAQKTITDIRKAEIDTQVKQIDQRIQSVQALATSERLGEAASAAEVTHLKGEQLKLQLDAVRKSIAEEEKLRKTQLEGNLKDLQQQYDAVAGAASPQTATLARQVETSRAAAQATSATLKDLEAQYQSALRSGNNFQAGILEAQIAKARAASQQNIENLKNFQSQYDAAIKGGDKKEAARLATEINNTKAAMALSSQRLTELNSQESTLLTQTTANQAEALKQRRAEELKDFDERQTQLQADYDRRLISEAEFNRRSVQITKGKIQEELSQLAEQRKTLLSTPQGRADKEGLEAIASAEAKLRGELASQEEKADVERYQVRQRHYENEATLLEYSLTAGLVTEQEYNTQSLSNTQAKLNSELEEVQRQRSTLKSQDKQALEDLAAQEADIRKRGLQALQQDQERKIAIMQRTAKRVSDEATLAETEQLTDIQELRNQKLITETEAEELRTNERGLALAAEVKATEKQLADLMALPKPDDPVEAQKRQDDINAIRLRASQLALQLSQNQGRQEEALTNKIKEQIDLRTQAISNAVTKQNLDYERSSKLQEALTKSLERQNKLLQARKELGNSLLSYVTGELGILAQLANTETERQRFTETAATVKLRSLKEQQAIELQILDSNLKQNLAALELEKIKSRSSQTQNLADVAQAKANIAKTQASTDLTPEQKRLQLEADVLSLQAKLQEGAGLAINQESLEQQKDTLIQQYRDQVSNTRRSQEVETGQARAAQVEATVNPIQKEQRRKQLRNDLLKNRFDTTNQGFVEREQKEYSRGEPGAGSGLNTNTPQIATPKPLTDFDAALRNFARQQGIDPALLSSNSSLADAINDLDSTIKSTQSGIQLSTIQPTQQTPTPATSAVTPETKSAAIGVERTAPSIVKSSFAEVKVVGTQNVPLNVKVVSLPASGDAAKLRKEQPENTPTPPPQVRADTQVNTPIIQPVPTERQTANNPSFAPVVDIPSVDIPVTPPAEVEVPVAQVQPVEIPITPPAEVEVPVADVPSVQIPVETPRKIQISVAAIPPAQIPVEQPDLIDVPVAGVPLVEIPVEQPAEVEVFLAQVPPVQIPVTQPAEVEVPVAEIPTVDIPVNPPTEIEVPVAEVQPVSIPVTAPEEVEIAVAEVQPVSIPVTAPAEVEIPIALVASVEIPVNAPAEVEVLAAPVSPVEIPVTQPDPINVPVAEVLPVEIPVTAPEEITIPVAEVLPVNIPVTPPTEIEVSVAEIPAVEIPVTPPGEVKIPIAQVTPMEIPITPPGEITIPVTEVPPVEVPVTPPDLINVPVAEVTPVEIPVKTPAEVEMPVIEVTPIDTPVNPPAEIEVPVAEVTPVDIPVIQPREVEVSVAEVTPVEIPVRQPDLIEVLVADIPDVEVPVITPPTVEIPVAVPLVSVQVSTPDEVSVPVAQVEPVNMPVNPPAEVEVPVGKGTPVEVPVQTPAEVKVPVADVPLIEIPVEAPSEVEVPVASVALVQIPVEQPDPIKIQVADVPLVEIPVEVPVKAPGEISIPVAEVPPVNVPVNTPDLIDVLVAPVPPVDIPVNQPEEVNILVAEVPPVQIPVDAPREISIPVAEVPLVEVLVNAPDKVEIPVAQMELVNVPVNPPAEVEVSVADIPDVAIPVIPPPSVEIPVSVPAVDIPVVATKPKPVNVETIIPSSIPVEVTQPAEVEVPVAQIPPVEILVTPPGKVEVPVTEVPPVNIPVTAPREVEVPVAEIPPVDVPVELPAEVKVPVAEVTPVEIPVTAPDLIEVQVADVPPVQILINAPTEVKVPVASVSPVEIPVEPPTEVKVSVASVPPVEIPVNALLEAQVPVAEVPPVSIPVEAPTEIEIAVAQIPPVDVPVNQPGEVEIAVAEVPPVDIPVTLPNQVSIPIAPVDEVDIPVNAPTEVEVLVASVPPPIPVKTTQPEPVNAETITPPPIEVTATQPAPVEIETITPAPISVEATQPDPVSVETISPDSIPVEATEPEPVSVETIPPLPIEVFATQPDSVSVETIPPPPIPIEATQPEPVNVETITPPPIEVVATPPEPVSVETLVPPPVEVVATPPAPVSVETVAPAPIEVVATPPEPVQIPVAKVPPVDISINQPDEVIIKIAPIKAIDIPVSQTKETTVPIAKLPKDDKKAPTLPTEIDVDVPAPLPPEIDVDKPLRNIPQKPARQQATAPVEPQFDFLSLLSLPNPVFNFSNVRSQSAPQPISASTSSNAELIAVIGQLKTVMERSQPPVINQTNSTENHFDREGFSEREFAKKIEQQQRDAQYRVLQELQRRA